MIKHFFILTIMIVCLIALEVGAKDDAPKATLDTQQIYEALGKVYFEMRPSVSEIEKWLENYDLLQVKYPPSEEYLKYNLFKGIRGLSWSENSIVAFNNYAKKYPNSRIQDALFFGIGCYHYYRGSLQEAVIAFNNLKTTFKDSYLTSLLNGKDFEALKTEAQELKLIQEQYKEITDEKLWKLGNLYWRAMSKSWNQAEVGYHMSLPLKLFRELITKYPQSPYAAQADYQIINYEQGLAGEGGDVSSNDLIVQRYQGFIRKYPRSTLIPDVELMIQSLSLDSNIALKQTNDSYSRENYAELQSIKKALNAIKKRYSQNEHIVQGASHLLSQIDVFEKDLNLGQKE